MRVRIELAVVFEVDIDVPDDAIVDGCLSGAGEEHVEPRIQAFVDSLYAHGEPTADGIGPNTYAGFKWSIQEGWVFGPDGDEVSNWDW